MRRTALLLAAFITMPALADDMSYEMSWSDCLQALRDTAQQAKIPLAYSVNTADRKDFTIHTTGGTIVMRCDRRPKESPDGLMTVSTPGNTSIAPYVEEGYRRAK